MKIGIYFFCGIFTQTRYTHQRGQVGVANRACRAKMKQQRLFACGADTLYLVQDGCGDGLGAYRAVICDYKTVRLVTNRAQ